MNTKSEIPEMARALAACAGPIDSERLERGILGSCVYADAIVRSDDIIDYWSGGIEWARQVPLVGACFLEAAMIWAELFPPASSFWCALRRYHQEYLEAMSLEGAIASGARSWESCDEALCLQIVRGKNGPVRALAALVAGLANDDGLRDDLEALTLGYFAANQMFDDIKDWREDIRDGNISLVLRRAAARRPTLDDLPALRVTIFTEEHVDDVLRLACRELRAQRTRAQRLGATRFMLLIDRRLAQFTALADQLRADLGRSSRRIAAGAEGELRSSARG